MKMMMGLNFGLLSLMVFTISCGQNLKPSATEVGTTDKSSCATALCDETPQQPVDQWKDVDLDGTVSAGVFGTHKVVDIDKVNNLLLISVPLPVNPVDATGSIPIKKFPGTEISVEASDNGYAMVLKIPLKYIVRGVEMSNVSKLPNGNPLPGIPDGELPRLGLKIYKNNNEAYLYLGKGAVGIFVPTPKFNPYVSITFPIKNKSQRKIIGYFASVAEQNLYAGGFFLSIVLPDSVQRAIDNIIP